MPAFIVLLAILLLAMCGVLLHLDYLGRKTAKTVKELEEKFERHEHSNIDR